MASTRRGVLQALGGSVALASLSGVAGGRTERVAPLHVRVYPGLVRDDELRPAWRLVHVDAALTIARTLRILATHARDATDLDRIPVRLDPARPVDLAASNPTFDELMDAFRARVHDRQAVSGDACHLLLWWGPLDYQLGYGGVRGPTSRVARLDDEGAYVLANVGATEQWDGRELTRAIAVHEVLHAYVSPSTVEAIVDSRCDHDLGSVRRVDDETARVSPLAAAYVGEDEPGLDTTWSGTGCWTPEAYHHDDVEGVTEWIHEARPGEGEKQAVARYLERHYG